MENVKNGFRIIGKTILFVIIFLLIMSSLGMLIARIVPLETLSQTAFQRITFILQTVTVILAILVVYGIFDKRRGLYLGWGQGNKFKLFLEGCIWGIACITTVFLLIWIFRGVSVQGISFRPEVLSSMIFPLILFILVSVNEELLSRGYLYGLIKRDFGAKASIVVNSGLFALLHITNPGILESPLPLLNLFLAGILFGVAREASKGLWVPIGIHFTWNFFLGNIYGLSVSGMDIGGSIVKTEVIGHNLVTGGGFGPEGSILTSFIIIGFTFAIWKWYGSKKHIYKYMDIKRHRV